MTENHFTTESQRHREIQILDLAFLCASVSLS
jgi:hypothetical protein